MSRPYDLLIVGELNPDIILTGDVIPRFDQAEQLVDDLAVCAGSSSAIFAASASKMGLRVLFGSLVGDDLFGRYMIEELRRAGIDPSFVEVNPALKTGAGVMLSRGQNRAIFTYLGAIAAVSSAQVNPAWYGKARHLHVASPFLLSALRPTMPAMMRAAHEAGMTVSLDTNWDPAERWAVDDLLEHLDLFLPNENELLAIAREHDLERAIARISVRAPVLVVKRGERGAIAVRGSERVEAPAFQVPVTDTTGAGDTFDGGFVAAWLRGEPLQRCLLLASACAALKVGHVGGFVGQPTWDEAEAFTRRPHPTWTTGPSR